VTAAERGPPRTVPGVTPRLRIRLQRLFGAATRLSPRLAARLALELFVLPPRRPMDAVDVPIVARATRPGLLLGRNRVHVLEWRPQDAPADAPAVLLLHGWGSHAARFGDFVDPLLERGFRVIGIDAPAHGESAGRRSDLGQFRAALSAALGQFAPVECIVAHSLGACAAVWQMADDPHPDVRSLVVIGMPRDVGYVMESFELVLGLRPEVRAALRRAFTARFGAAPESFSAQALAERLHVPTLVVHDEDDDVAPLEHARNFAAALGRGRLRATRGLNHSGPLRDAASIAEVVRFADEHRSPRGRDALRS
jgi:pimeloyl-ACP methyl ester carboxylesterase